MIMSSEIFQILALKAEHSLSLARGEQLFRREDRVEWIYLLVAGAVDLVRFQRDGKETVINRAASGTVLAEASLYSERYHCDGVCAQDSTLYLMPKEYLKKLLREEHAIAHEWATYLAFSLHKTRHRVELLSRKTIANRLTGWLEWNGGKLPLKGQWKNLAVELDVTPEALYREIAKRK